MPMNAKLKEAIEILKLTVKRDDCTGLDARLSYYTADGEFVARYNDAEGLDAIERAMGAVTLQEMATKND